MIAWNRKYRPAKASELDQEKVREYFLRVWRSGKVSQAYLFTGPKGTGKTSTARILAAALNCDLNREVVSLGKGAFEEPCGKCESCVGIREGNSHAVIEIDAASNRGIDDIRRLRERIGLISAGGLRSVYIIDEVHMLTKEAFNALLKTLEEPPRHVVFCLCTTEEDKLLPTIVSRCTRVGFSQASKEEVQRSLARVVAGERLEIEDEALALIAQGAEGSFRDGVKVLEQLVSLDRKITAVDVEAELGMVGRVEMEKLLAALRRGDAKTALGELERVLGGGVTAERLTKLLVVTAQAQLEAGIESGKVDRSWLELIEVLIKAFGRFGDVPIESLPLEMAIVEYCLRVNPELAGSDGAGGAGGEAQATPQQQPAEAAEKLQVQSQPDQVKPETDKKVGKPVGQKRVGVEPKGEVGDAAEGRVESNGGNGSLEPVSFKAVQEKWSQVLREVQKKNHGLMTLLNSAQIDGFSDNWLAVKVGYKFHKEQLEQERYLRVLEEVFEVVFGIKPRLRIEVAKLAAKKEVEGHDNLSGKIAEEDLALIETVEEVFGN